MKNLTNAVSVCLLLLFLGAITSVQAQVSLTATGGTLTGTYTTIGAAFTAINAGTYTGTITLDITANCNEGTTPAALNASGSGAASYISVTLRPTVTATISGNPPNNRGLIELNGADNVTIDGDIVGGGVIKDLTLQNTNTSTVQNTAVIRLIGSSIVGNCRNNTIQNCNIKGNLNSTSYTSSHYVTGIYAAAESNITNANTSGLNYDKLTINNNTITNAFEGIVVRSSSSTTGVCDSLSITNNIIGSNINTDYVVYEGIRLENIAAGDISNNTIFNIRLLASIYLSNVGIFGTGITDLVFSSNRIYGVACPSPSGATAYGIHLVATNTLIVNNVIYDITSTYYTGVGLFPTAIGIRLGGTALKVYYNSVNLYGDCSLVSTSNAASAALYGAVSLVSIDARNNIFNNKLTTSGGTGTKRHIALWLPGVFNFANGILNNNSYNVLTDGDHFMAKMGNSIVGQEYATLSAWKAISQVNQPTNDNASIPVVTPAPFTADDNLTIPANTMTGIESGGVVIPSLGTNVDHLAFVRPKSGINFNLAPDIGAYEFDGLPVLINDVGLLALTTPLPIGCYGSSENVTVTIRNYGTTTIPAGTNIPITVNVTGAVTQTLNGTYTVGGAGFAPLSNVNFTLPTTLNMTNIGTYTFNGATAMTSPADANSVNNAMPTTNRVVVNPLSIPYAENFNAVVGNIIPMGWTADNGSTFDFLVTNATAEHGTSATRGLAVNLYTSNPTSFATLPKMGAFTAAGNFSFDYRITNSSGYANPGGTATTLAAGDSLYVQYSIDCGVTYTTIPASVITSANHVSTNTFVKKSFVLPSAVIGNNVIFKYIAKWGAGNYYIDIDNINISNCSATPPSDITPPANLAICSGNSTSLSATGTGTLTWYDVSTGGTALGTGSPYTTPVLTATDTFFVDATASSCSSTRTMVIVTVNPKPNVTFTIPAAQDTICSNDVAFTLTGGSPTAGTYSGTGVSAGMFDPSVAGVGSFTIKYKFTNGFGCADSANSTIVVKLCTGINTTFAQGYYLGQNYPNPTQGNAQIEVRTPKTEQVVVTLMSLEGKIVETLLNESMSGTKMITVNTENIPAGIYIYRMQAGSFVQTKRLTIIK